MSVVRSSKFRHVFGAEAKKDHWVENVRPSNCAFDGSFVAANEKLIAFCVEIGGGGAFCVIPVTKTGRLEPDIPKVNAHKEYVLDLKWNPFNDGMLASCSEDGTIRIWEFDEKHGVLSNMDTSKALVEFAYHERRCVVISWHPIAANVLMSVSQEPKICIWNLDDGVCEVEIDNIPSIIHGAEWSLKGDKIVTTSKDKKIRIYDARKKTLLVESDGHAGQKPQRAVFTFDDNMLFTSGFSKMSERQFGMWKFNGNELEEMDIVELDTSNGTMVPYFDPDTKMLYLAAKGDSVVRYYELTQEEPYYYYISTFQSKDVQRCPLAPIPKRSVDVNACEMMKFYKLIAGSGNKAAMIKPVSFTVPRKSEMFQDDLYPDAVSIEPGCEAEEWFANKDFEPKRFEMVTRFVGQSKAKGVASGGGLKKGGLKGLKAKKEAKEASKATAAAAPAKTPSPEPVKSDSKPSSSASPPPSASPVVSGVDEKVVKGLQDEIKSLKDNEKKMQKEIKTLNDKLKDYDKLTGDIKLLCDAVKKNDERLNALEALVQEEDDEE